MFGRDDKWVGTTAAALQLYLELKVADVLPAEVEAAYRSRVESRGDGCWRTRNGTDSRLTGTSV